MVDSIVTPTLEAPVAPVEPVTPPIEAPLTEPGPGETQPVEPITPTEPPSEEGEQFRRTAFQKRINELTREKYDLRREIDRLKAGGTPPVVSPPTTPAGEPRVEDYDTTEAYIKALALHSVAQAREIDREERRQQAVLAQQQTEMEKFVPQVEAARTKYTDFDDVTSAPIYGPLAQSLLYGSVHGAEIAYYLGTHPQELERLNGANLMEAARLIVKLETRFEPLIQRTVSGAPAPIIPVKGAAPVTMDPSKMTAQQYYDAKAAGLIREV